MREPYSLEIFSINSLAVRLHLDRLQLLQETVRLLGSSDPPLDTGTRWSIWNGPSVEPQYRHLLPSLRITSRLNLGQSDGNSLMFPWCSLQLLTWIYRSPLDWY